MVLGLMRARCAFFAANRMFLAYIFSFAFMFCGFSAAAVDFVLPNIDGEPNVGLLRENLLNYYNAKQIGIAMRVEKFEYTLPKAEADALLGFVKSEPLVCKRNDGKLTQLRQKLGEIEASCKNGVVSLIDFSMRGNNQKSVLLQETVINNNVKTQNNGKDAVSVVDSILSVYDAKTKTLSLAALSEDAAIYFESPFIHMYLLNPFFRYITPAKILPQSVSIEKTKDGFTLGVHIADVSHYVTENSALDREAFKRGTSVYLADRVIPMLPKKLSNGICSLNEKVDRLTLSVIMDIDENGNVKNHKIAPSVINSKHRMTYNNVYKIIVGDKKLKKEYDDIYEMLKNMESLAHILHDKRMKKGGIDFNIPELKVKFDENGKVSDIYKYETNFANQIIEEFMLICNQTVAQHMFWQNIPFIYRTHDVPSEEKTRAFNEYIASMGFSIKHLAKPHPNQYAKLLSEVKGTQYEKPIATSMLRSLMKAEYTSENKGHFGLAFEYYCHFTSPIRRYPDLAIHRIIKEYLLGKMTQERMNYLSSFTKDAALRSSKTEVNAQNAERDVLDMKICEYMEDKVGEHFDATVSSVTSFGMFAELENGAEGLVRLADMNDDYYVFDEKHLCLVGEKTKNVYKIGDKIRIVVKRVSKELKEIDFEPEE